MFLCLHNAEHTYISTFDIYYNSWILLFLSCKSEKEAQKASSLT